MEAPPPVPSKSPHPLHQSLPPSSPHHRPEHASSYSDEQNRHEKLSRGARSPSSPRRPWHTPRDIPASPINRQHTSFDTLAQPNPFPFAHPSAEHHSVTPHDPYQYGPEGRGISVPVTSVGPTSSVTGHPSHEIHHLLSHSDPGPPPATSPANDILDRSAPTGDVIGADASQRFSHRLILALRSKPTLARSWEKRSFGEELRTAPLETSHNGNLAM